MTITTAIIPCRVDSSTRLRNVDVTIRYLLKHTDAKIILTECDTNQKIFLKDNERVLYRFRKNNEVGFHRTKIINEMLSIVDTPIVANYDADVLLPPEAYKTAESLIMEKAQDLVYPYGFEKHDQIRIPDNESNQKFRDTLELTDLNISNSCVGFCRYGHVQFFKTSSYRNGFMENENYRHYCPEDEERGSRFQKLGYNVSWFRSWVLHQEHPPTPREEGVDTAAVYELHNQLMSYSKEQLIAYYINQNYHTKYTQ